MTDASKLADGFYWVRLEKERWEPAELRQDRWWLIDASPMQSSDLIKIDPTPIVRQEAKSGKD